MDEVVDREIVVKINSDVGVFWRDAQGQRTDAGKVAPFSSVMNNLLKVSDGNAGQRTYGREEAMMNARRDNSYADDLIQSFINDLGGPLLDCRDPDAIRFAGSGELVTAEAMAYYREMNDLAKLGYKKIYDEGQANGSSSEEIFERFLDYNSSLPVRYKGMANLDF
jgi:hypothetical protein